MYDTGKEEIDHDTYMDASSVVIWSRGVFEFVLTCGGRHGLEAGCYEGCIEFWEGVRFRKTIWRGEGLYCLFVFLSFALFVDEHPWFMTAFLGEVILHPWEGSEP
jgi:hypothetical protein